MHTCRCAYMHGCPLHVCAQTQIRSHTHVHTHIRIPIHWHAHKFFIYMDIYMWICFHIQLQMDLHLQWPVHLRIVRLHVGLHVPLQKHFHTHTHTNTRTYTHTRTHLISHEDMMFPPVSCYTGCLQWLSMTCHKSCFFKHEKNAWNVYTRSRVVTVQNQKNKLVQLVTTIGKWDGRN